MRSLLTLITLLFCISTVAAAADSSFTQSDRERMIRIEEGLKAANQRIDATNQRIDDLKSDMNRRFEQVDKQFGQVDKQFGQVDKQFGQVDKRLEQMTAFMLWGFGILLTIFFSGMGFLIGFVLWDRRTALAPAIRKTNEIEKRTDLFEKIFRELAKKSHDVKEVLKHVGLM